MAKKMVQEILSTPSHTSEKNKLSVSTTEKTPAPLAVKTRLKLAEEYWNTLGPGLTTGAADDDPSGIATYSQAGAQYGFQLLWLSVFTYPFMSIIQEMCARIGLVTGRGLAANIRHNFSKKALYFCTALLFIANTLNIGADLGAMALGAQLIAPKINFAFLVIFFALTSLILQIFTTYAQYSKYLKYLALALFAYIFSALSVNLDWGEVLRHAAIPTIVFSKDQIFLICAILGTTISPYLFFWQTSQEVEEQILNGASTIKLRQQSTTTREVHHMQTDVWLGMFFSNLVMFFIIAACAATLYANGITQINTAADAAIALRPFAGEGAFFLFAVGIIGTGMLGIPVLAGSTSYALSESFGWKFGLYRKLKEAYAFYGVIIVSMIIGLIINFTHLDPIKALIYSAVANGIIAPFIIFFIIKISSNKKVMGERANSPLVSSLGWVIMGVMALAGSATLISFFWK